MPRYFFNVHDGVDILDTQGTVLRNADAARRLAVRASGEAIRDLGEKFWDSDERWEMVVTDGDGREVAKLQFSGKAPLT